MENKKVEIKNEATEVAAENLWRIPEWFSALPEIQKKNLSRYRDEIIKFNKTINLVSTKTAGTLDLTHFADCILASKIIYPKAKGKTVYDIGSGNGFPGIVFAILYSDVTLKLVDSDERKTEFLKHCVATLGLGHVEVLCKPIESLAPNSIDFAMMRGFAGITKALLGVRKVFKKGGELAHIKSEEWASEVGAMPGQVCEHWGPALLGEYKLPVGSSKFAVVITKKLTD